MGWFSNMNCCIHCFEDKEIQDRIRSLKQKGTCNFCGHEDSYIYDINSKDRSLIDDFEGLLDIYSTGDSLPDNYPKEYLSLLKDELCDTWNIFKVDKQKAYLIVTEICSARYEENPAIFDSSIGVAEIVDADYLEKHSILKTYSWDDFVKEIKIKNRFHTEHINKKALELFCSYTMKSYKEGDVFYRARISDEGGYEINQMGAPKSFQASAGRANPEGISCLYLSSDVETTLNEVRAGVHDFVTVGKFILRKDIDVVDFKNIHNISPFLELDFTQHAINKRNLIKIGDEIAKPLRRSDSFLDYLPTQYISDFIKSKGYYGIEFKSTMCMDGYNLAIFNETLFECIEVEVRKIESLQYGHRKLH